ncbi:hypothetical protein RFI_39153, partial [Reticulomyxa filosa]
MSLQIIHLDIQEKLEEARAECKIKFQIRLQWLFEQEDYLRYSQTSDRQEEYEPTFKPELEITTARNVASVVIDKARAVNVRHLFDDEFVDQLHKYENIAKTLDGKKIQLFTTFWNKRVSLVMSPGKLKPQIIAKKVSKNKALTFTVRALDMGVMLEYVEKTSSEENQAIGNAENGSNGGKKLPRSRSQIWEISRSIDGARFKISSLRHAGFYLGIKEFVGTNIMHKLTASCTANEAQSWEIEGD